MVNQVILDSDPGQSDAASQSSSFPFTSEQCQQLLSMLSSHASSFGTNDAIHSINSALSGISYASFQDSVCLNLKNSVFAENPSNKTAYNEETWILEKGLLTILSIPFHCLLKLLVPSLLLFICLMVKRFLSHT